MERISWLFTAETTVTAKMMKDAAEAQAPRGIRETAEGQEAAGRRNPWKCLLRMKRTTRSMSVPERKDTVPEAVL